MSYRYWPWRYRPTSTSWQIKFQVRVMPAEHICQCFEHCWRWCAYKVYLYAFVRAVVADTGVQLWLVQQRVAGVTWYSRTVCHCHSGTGLYPSLFDIQRRSWINPLESRPEPALEPPEPPGRGGPHDPQGPHVTAGQIFYRPVHTPLRHIRVQFYSVNALKCVFFSRKSLKLWPPDVRF